jgi:predicted nucleic acid-binding Zn ribbon protein
LPEIIEALDKLAEEKKYVGLHVCPKCKSPLIKRVNSTSGDIFSHMGFTPPKYECIECSWRSQLVIKATNKPITVKDVVIMAETNEIDNNEQ